MSMVRSLSLFTIPALMSRRLLGHNLQGQQMASFDGLRLLPAQACLHQPFHDIRPAAGLPGGRAV